MNSFINVLLLILTLPTMLLTIFVGFDLPIEFLKTTGDRIPYKFEVFLLIGMLYAMISLRRSVRRWMGVAMTNRVEKFAWNKPISKERKKRVVLYTFLESLLLSFLAIAYYFISSDTFIVSAVLLFFSAESLIFLWVNLSRKFRVGITSKAILVSDREVILIYLAGLRKVSVSQQTIYFDYIQDLQLSFPIDCIEKGEQSLFFQKLEEQLDSNRVLFQNTNAKK